MREFLISAVFLCAAVGTASAANPPVWVGGFLVTAAVTTGTGCADANVSVNEMLTGVYRPKILSTDPRSSIQLLRQQNAHRIEAASSTGKFVASGGYSGLSLGGRNQIKNFTGTYTNFVTTPASPTATTKFLTLTIRVVNFTGATCATTFNAGLTLKP